MFCLQLELGRKICHLLSPGFCRQNVLQNSVTFMTFLMFLQQLANWFPSMEMRTLGNLSAYPNLYSTFSTELAGPQSAQCPG
jgi:hypothetical protein